VRFARTGRVVVGQVTSTPNVVDVAPGERPRRFRSIIFVSDPELGSQTVECYGELPRGQAVPVLCLTSAGRCESADVIHERLSLWPFTPTTLVGGTKLMLAASFVRALRPPTQVTARTLVLAHGKERESRAPSRGRQDRIRARRYIVTSQTPTKKWHEML